MSAPLSIVVPTLDADRDLPETAAALLDGVVGGLVRELIVSDGGSVDETVSVARALGARIVTGPAGRGGQLRRGVEAARGPWLLLLHADTHPGRGWTDAVAAHLTRPERAGYFRLRFRARGAAPRLVAGWANLRSRAFGLPYGDQGLLIHRDLLEEIGGVPDLPLMEDVTLARRLRGRLTVLDADAWTSAERYLAEGWARRGGRNLWTLAQHLAGAESERLAVRYRPR